MATPTADSYTAPAGARNVRLGRGTPYVPPSAPNNLIALVGDSITSEGVRSVPWYWQNGRLGAPLRTVLNVGRSGSTVGQWATGASPYIDQSYLDGSVQGLAGIAAAHGVAKLGWVYIRLGTNDANVQPINGTWQTNYQTLVAKALTYAERVILYALPPIGGSNSSKSGNPAGYNAYIQTLVAADPAHLSWIDDCADLRNVDGTAKDIYFDALGLHPTPAGVMLMGIAGATQLATILSGMGYTSPLALSAADVYPTTLQWFPNPANVGTSGTRDANWSGQLINGLSIGSVAPMGGALSIVAADVGDTNTTPWQRVTPAVVSNTRYISISGPVAGRAISGVDPANLDFSVQIRFNAFNASLFSVFRAWVQGTTGAKVAADTMLQLDGAALTATVTMRASHPRPAAVATASATFYLYLECDTDFSGAMGSFDFRCITLRG